MNKRIIPVIYFVFLATILSCKKNSKGDDLVTGKWKLFEINNGLGGITRIPASENHIYTFTSNHQFTYSKNDTLIKSGSYATFRKLIYLANSEGWFIGLYPENSEWVISRDGSQLYIWQDVVDGGGLRFNRY